MQIMKMAMAKQKNVSMDVKNGAAQRDELFDVIKSYHRNRLIAEIEKRRGFKQANRDHRANNFEAARDKPCGASRNSETTKRRGGPVENSFA